MRAPHVTDLSGVDVAVYGIPFDTATTYRTGARFGPEAIRSASALIRPYHPVHDVNVVEALSIVDYGDLPVSPGDTERTYGQVEDALAPIVDAGVFPAAMGGDHSITLPELRVLARKHGPLRPAAHPNTLLMGVPGTFVAMGPRLRWPIVRHSNSRGSLLRIYRSRAV